MRRHRTGPAATMAPTMAATSLLLAIAVALSGCGGKPDKPGIATADGGAKASAGAGATPSASADRNEQQRQFVQCMREHGVDMPDPEPGADGQQRLRLGQLANVERSKLEPALQACRTLLPDGGSPQSFSPEEIQQLIKFAGCMREHGIDVPDPDPATGRINVADAGINVGDPGFQSAMQACRGLLPSGVQRFLG